MSPYEFGNYLNGELKRIYKKKYKLYQNHLGMYLATFNPMVNMYKNILEETQKGEFSNFSTLNENQQIEIMKSWDQDVWIKFCMQNTVSDDEVFEPIFNLIDTSD